jgi:hypothetical protein
VSSTGAGIRGSYDMSWHGIVCCFCRSDPRHPRRGYMGHVTRIANQLVSRSTNDASLLNGLYMNSAIVCIVYIEWSVYE